MEKKSDKPKDTTGNISPLVEKISRVGSNATISREEIILPAIEENIVIHRNTTYAAQKVSYQVAGKIGAMSMRKRLLLEKPPKSPR